MMIIIIFVSLLMDINVLSIIIIIIFNIPIVYTGLYFSAFWWYSVYITGFV